VSKPRSFDDFERPGTNAHHHLRCLLQDVRRNMAKLVFGMNQSLDGYVDE